MSKDFGIDAVQTKSAARHRWLIGVAATAVACGTAGGAFAQSVPASGSGNQVKTDNGVEEVIVTAEHRKERLQDVPVAISAFTSNQLNDLGIQSSKDLTKITPGLNFTQSLYSPQPTIRGIGSRGTGGGEESIVPIYIDGVYESDLPAVFLNFNSIERIEVLKGPQPTLYGRNSVGGAINIITRMPSATPSAQASFTYGRFGDLVGKAYVTGGTEKIAADLAVYGSRNDGYLRNLFDGRKTANSSDFAVRTKIHIVPSTRYEFIVSASHSNSTDTTGLSQQPIDGNTVARQLVPTLTTPTGYNVDLNYGHYDKLSSQNLSLTAKAHFDSFEVTSITGYERDYLKVRADADASPVLVENITLNEYVRAVYQELYATSTGDGPFHWIAGLVYYHRSAGDKPVEATTPALSLFFNSGVLVDSYAAYAQGTYDITDALSVSFGGRYTSEHLRFNSQVILAPGIVLANLASKATYPKFTPSGTIQYKINPNLNVYFRAGQGFKSGTFSGTATNQAAAAPVKPEVATQYEVGMKSQPAQWLTFNMAGFYTDYTNLQSTIRTQTGLSGLENAGGAQIYGMEAEAFATPVERLNLRAGLSLLHAKYTDFPNASANVPVAGGGNTNVSIDATGNNIIRTPFVTFNFGGDYTVPFAEGELTLSGNFYYSGKSYWEVSNRVVEKPHYLLDAQLGWLAPNGKYRISLWGKNLLNQKYNITESTSGQGDMRVLAPPITYGVTLDVYWD